MGGARGGNWKNYDDVLAQLHGAGLLVDGVEVGTTGPKRCKVSGEDHEKRGWYWLNDILLDDGAGNRDAYIVGAFGVYHGNDNGKQSIKLNRDKNAPAITDDQRAAIAARQKENQARMKAMRQAEINRAATEAGLCWRKYVADGESDYLQRKGVGAHGLRFAPAGNGTVAVPMADATGKVWGLQIIRGKDRGNKLEKQYWPKGLQKQGHYHLIGGSPRGLVLITEGYATAASMFEATQIPTVVAFDAGNLLPVTQSIKKTYPKARIIVCADDDYLTPGNPGVTAAQTAAHAVSGAAWMAPVFATDRPQDKKGPTDFNDLHALEGLHTVRAQVETLLRNAGWEAQPPPARRETVIGGAGDRAAIPSMLQIEEALDRFALVYGGKGTMYDHVEHMLVPKADVLDILPEHGWRDMRAHKKVVRIDEIGFDPGGTDPRITCNLWGGWPTVPRQGKCDVLLSLLEYLCVEEEHNREVYLWVLRWLAYPIQNPGAKMRTALVFHGPQGAGKNLFFETVMGIYGEYGRIVDQSAIEDKFNDWSSRKLFLIADEVVAQAELYHVKNKLKSLITGEWIRINPKNVAAHDEKNHVNLVFLSNEHKPLQLDKDDRRYTVVWTPEKLPESYYQSVREELDNGGMAALHHHLLNLDLDGFNEHSKPPMTGAKRDLIDVSLGSVERFLREWEMGETPYPFCPCYRSDLYSAYNRWCRGDGVSKPREASQFYGHLAKLSGWENKTKDRFENTHYTGRTIAQRMIVPSPEAMEQAHRNSARDMRKTPDKTQAQWLTDCFFEFNNALGDAK